MTNALTRSSGRNPNFSFPALIELRTDSFPFRCPYLAETTCFHYDKLCDGVDDCGDGSDEVEHRPQFPFTSPLPNLGPAIRKTR